MLKYRFPLCLMCLSPVTAHAMADVSDIFKPYVSDSVMYDSNLFRQNSSVGHTYLNPSTGQKLIKNDVMNQATVGSAVNYDLGRQKLVLDLKLSYNSFLNNSFLDNVSSNDRVAWQWQLGKQLSGDVGYNYVRAMGGFTNTTFFGLDMISDNNAFTNLNYAWHPRWRVRTGFDFLDSQHSASARKSLDRQLYTGSIGVDYTTPSSNSAGLRYAYTDGSYPNRQITATSTTDNKYQQNTVNSLLQWNLTSKISFNGNVGYTSRQYPDFSNRNFNGPTYTLTLKWMPVSKVVLSLSGWRELSTWSDQTASYIVTEGFSLSPMWQVSPKLALTAKFSRQTLDYAGDVQKCDPLNPQSCLNSSTNNGLQRHDTVLSGQVAVNYTPVQNAELSLGYQGATRDTNYKINSLLQNYTFNSVFVSALFRF